MSSSPTRPRTSQNVTILDQWRACASAAAHGRLAPSPRASPASLCLSVTASGAFRVGEGAGLEAFERRTIQRRGKADIVQLTDDPLTDSPGRRASRSGAGCDHIDSPIATILADATRQAARGLPGAATLPFLSDFLDGETRDMARADPHRRRRWRPHRGEVLQDTGLLVFKRNSTWLVDANPLLSVAEFSVKLIHRTIGCSAKRASRRSGRMSGFSRAPACRACASSSPPATTRSPCPSRRPSRMSCSASGVDHAHWPRRFYNNYYLLSVPVNSDAPDTVLVFHSLTGGWTFFTEWDAELLYEQPYEAPSRLLPAGSMARSAHWLDYYASEDEPDDAYEDGIHPLLLSFRS